MQTLLLNILLLTRNERAFQMGQALALPILLIIVGVVVLRRRMKKKREEESKNKNVVDHNS